jgi:putative ABC transport system permease protein
MKFLTAVARQLQFAARTLRRNPVFTVAAVAMFSLGIGTVSALFSVVDKVLLQPLPYRDPERLVQLITTSRVGEQRLASIPKFLFWQDHVSSFEAVAASDVEAPEVNLTEGSYRNVLKTARVSADYFRVLGAQLAIGRTFSAREDSPGGPKAVVISDRLWRRWLAFGFRPAGREILLDNIAYKIAGVLAPGAHLETSADVWFPLCADRRSNDHIGRVRVIARVRAGISLKEGDKDVDGTRIAFLQQYPSDSQLGAPVLFAEMFRAIPLRDAVVGDVLPALYILMGAAGFLLAISCANTAALLLARASRRTREMAARLAAGAQRQQILFQLLTESVLLSLGGGAGSLLLGYVGVRALLAISPADLPRIGANGSAIALDWRVFLITLIVSAFVGVLCGLIPAVNASRTDINVLVKDSTSDSGMTFRRNSWRSHLVIVEISFSLVLLAGAGLLIRTFVAKRAINRRFDERNVMTLSMSLSNPRFDETTQVAQLVRHAERRLRTIPGVSAVATTCALPLTVSLPMPFTIVSNDHSMVGRYDGTAAWRSVSAEYFKVFHIRLLRGRMFAEGNDEHAAGVALINRAMARRYWQAIDANPIGDFITIGEGLGPGASDTPRQIIGVVDDVRDAGFEFEPSMYVPVSQISNWLNARNNRLRPITWVIRIDGTRPAPAGRIQQELRSASGGQPLGRPASMHEAIAESSARIRFYMTLLSVFAATALALTASGLYGLMSFAVQQRTEELAIRSALGATPRDVQRLVIAQALRLALWGAVAGIPLALALGRLTLSLIFGIQSWDPALLALIALLLGMVALFAAYVPSLRASRLNPATALRP